MSNIKQIVIHVENLTDEQQLALWHNLWLFADEKLEPQKDLMCFVISKKQKKIKESDGE